jgi:uncharacterized cupredoxin-like copper-binding protein
MFFAALLAAVPGHGLAHSGHEGRGERSLDKQEHPWGREGDPRKATRTIEVDMSDTMRFAPAALKVKRGETVLFVVRNGGKVMHEMVIGTEAELRRHAQLMKKHPGMEHDAPYMTHVAPGRQGRIAWTFTNAGSFMYGCLIPGHWEAGMKGTITVTD